MRLYLNEHPRTFVLIDSSFALVIRHPNPFYSSNDSSRQNHNHHDRNKSKDDGKNSPSSNKTLFEFLAADSLNLSNFKDITPPKSSNKKLHGFIGFLNLKGYIHLGFITRATKVASPQLTESILMIDDVDFYCLNSDVFDSWINTHEDDWQNMTSEDAESSLNGYPAASVKRLLSSGYFYFSKDFDITNTLQERGFAKSFKEASSKDYKYFHGFSWNTYMISGLVEFKEVLNPFETEKFNRTGFLTVITRGYAKSINITISENENALMTLISKQSCRKNGSIFGEKGCDDNGDVSNFVESEVIIYSQKFCFSYVIIRGNVPIFWELQTKIMKNHLLMPKTTKSIKLTRSYEASDHVFMKHFDSLSSHFGDVHIVNCLSSDKKSYKGQLNEIFESHYRDYSHAKVNSQSKTDIKAELESPSLINFRVTLTTLPLSASFVKRIGYTNYNPTEVVNPLTRYMVDFGAMFYDSCKNIYVGKQLGVFRVNSFDCLSKANFVSKVISQEVIELAFRDMGIPNTQELMQQHASLWSENDGVLSKLASLHSLSSSSSSSASSKVSFKKQLTRKYLNALRDPKTNEVAMSKLLGKTPGQNGVILYNPVHQYVSLQLKERASEYSFRENIKIFASTFNVNGTVYDNADLKYLIFPPEKKDHQNYDLVFIGFQEIVELTPGKMISAKSDNFIKWEKNMKKVLNEHSGSKEKYVSLWQWQMGGLALLLFIKESQIRYISNLEGSIKKTGLGGMSANKGGVAVSFNYSKTSICLICSHLAAGHSNVDERHQNYKTIAKGIQFFKHRRVRDHDAVIWLGDFNFRIDLPNVQVKALIESKDYQKLFEFDQLNQQMAAGESFPFYDEMEISFPPTYKFDNNTKTYDTSEKQRVPAWTDRILSLSKNKILRQELYSCSEDIIFSDHRPVYAIFNISVEVVNEKAKKETTHDIYENYTKTVGDINFLLTAADVTRYVTDLSDNAMPAPSSDGAKWWLESGGHAKIKIDELNEGDASSENFVYINPQAPVNPFCKSEESEFTGKAQLLKLLKASNDI